MSTLQSQTSIRVLPKIASVCKKTVKKMQHQSFKTHFCQPTLSQKLDQSVHATFFFPECIVHCLVDWRTVRDKRVRHSHGNTLTVWSLGCTDSWCHMMESVSHSMPGMCQIGDPAPAGGCECVHKNHFCQPKVTGLSILWQVPLPSVFA